MPAFPPFVPNCFEFEESQLRDFLLTKAYNASVALKSDTDLQSLYSTPRSVNLQELVKQNAPDWWSKVNKKR